MIRREFYLAAIVAFLISIAQYFLKTGANALPSLTFSLIIGLLLYILAMPILVFALMFGEISYIYPILALSFIFVSLISVFVFGEALNLVNWIGVCLIAVGVAIVK